MQANGCVEAYFHIIAILTMKTITLLFLLATLTMQAQDTETLTQRFHKIKDNSQTFKDYKVIKQVTLEGFWNSVEDTLAKQRSIISSNTAEIKDFNRKMDLLKQEIEAREKAVAEIEFDSNHITVLGISFHKASFISIFFIALAGLGTLLAISFTRSQLLYRTVREKSADMLVLNSEFEEYKHRAVEKQMKLSRELQDERNKLAELKLSR